MRWIAVLVLLMGYRGRACVGQGITWRRGEELVSLTGEDATNEYDDSIQSVVNLVTDRRWFSSPHLSSVSSLGYLLRFN